MAPKCNRSVLRAALVSCASALVVLFLAGPAVAQWIEIDKLTASDAAEQDQFGGSVAVSGDMAIIGAWGDDDLGSQSGSAYLFDIATGNQLHRLTASDGLARPLAATKVGGRGFWGERFDGVGGARRSGWYGSA